MNDKSAYPIVIVTGANAGVGYAICQRLLLQLIHRVPPDALPQKHVSQTLSVDKNTDIKIEDFTGYEGLTLILACRSVEKAEQARKELLSLLDTEVIRLQVRRDADAEHARRFKENLQIRVQRLDLASVDSVFKFSQAIQSNYPYVSHLVCNAGVASFSGYNWSLAIKQLITDFVDAVTAPMYKIQRIGELSEDGLGWVWQCNVFGHYILFRLLAPLLERYKNMTSAPARVLWMSSIESKPDSYDQDDYQLIKTDRPYEASKHQMDLLVGYFEHQQFIERQKGLEPPIRHFLCHPGVVRSNIALKSLNSTILDLCMRLAFLIAHYLGSVHHVIDPYKSAISAVHLMLVALPFVTVVSKTEKDLIPYKFGSCADLWFNEMVMAERVPEYENRQIHASKLAEQCDSLYQKYRKEVEYRF